MKHENKHICLHKRGAHDQLPQCIHNAIKSLVFSYVL